MLGDSQSKNKFPAQRRIYVGCFLIHFLLLLCVSARDTMSIIAAGYTFLPPAFRPAAAAGEVYVRKALGQGLPTSSLRRQILGSYLHSAGIDRGYGYFAPGVPNSHKLVFELHFADGHVEYELPQVRGKAGGLRLVALLDYIGQADSNELREVVFKMLAYSVWQEHPSATLVRAIFGEIEQPTALETMQGQSESYQFQYGYDFHFAPKSDNPPKP